MLPDSFVTPLDWNSIDTQQGEKKTECIFWTGREGQMCVQYFSPDTDVHYQPHSHSEYTFLICLDGEISKNQLGHTETIGPGEALIGNFGQEHTSDYVSRNGKPCRAVSISLDRRLMNVLSQEFALPAENDDKCLAFLGKVQTPMLMQCAREIADELQGKQPAHKIVVETVATRALVEMIRIWPRTRIEAVAADLKPRLPRREFIRAYEFMRWCRKEDFRLQHLCRFVASSEERFTRLFLASTSQTPASFYNRMLMERAKDLLRDSKLSVKEVGFELGFKTSSHFVTAFRREFSSSPQEYRQRLPVPMFCYS